MCLAVPGKVLDVCGDEAVLRVARVSFSGVVKEVSLALLPQAQPGDYVLVHAGFAITLIDEAAAMQSLRDLQAAGAMERRSP